jgi:hypothetical protein
VGDEDMFMAEVFVDSHTSVPTLNRSVVSCCKVHLDPALLQQETEIEGKRQFIPSLSKNI